MKSKPVQNQTRLFIKRMMMCAALGLAVPSAVMAQQTVFNDTFGSSTILGPSVPGGTPTASSTSYDILSAKNATATTNVSGHFYIITSATSSGNSEAQAIFTKYPVTLASLGDYVELDYTFNDATNMLNGFGGNSTGLFMGLFNSGGVPPQAGTLLWNGGYASSLTTADTGGTMNWVGYNAQMLYGQTAVTSWGISVRPVQTTLNNMDQGLLYNYNQTGSNHQQSPGVDPFPNLTIGAPYTAQLRITLSAAGTITVSNAMYAGTTVGGAMVFSNIVNFTTTSFVSTNFDGLAIGYRAGDSLSTHISWTNDITSITVIAGLAAQAGPYYTLTTSGNGCGGTTIGLNGSVTTNTYLLFNNGVNTGVSAAGTGSPITFGFISAPGIYTIVASNTVTASEGPMYGSVPISSGPPVVSSEPASVTAVTNVPSNFTIGASGTSLSYQWYKNGIILTNGGDVSGVTTTNLAFSAPQAADVAAYTVVIADPCGNFVTSTPPATLTLIPPHNLVWKGNINNDWDFSDLNFTLSGNPASFTNGDDVTFDNTSSQTTVAVTNSITPTLVTVNSSQTYTFNGAGKITGFSQLVDGGAGTVVIDNNDDFTGGTVISNGATLSIGDGTSTSGTLAGTVTVAAGGTLEYQFDGPGTANAPISMFNALAGSGTVDYLDNAGSILQTSLTAISSNFTGVINVQGYTSLHANDGNAGYALGNGSTINVPDNAQVWMDRSSTAYNDTFYIGGTGWQGGTVPPYTGAMRVFGCTVNGPINLTDNAIIGGTINGATIQSVISGSFQLQIWGTTNSYILVMGPTNGSPQGYSSTLITSGAISCANTNAISAGLLTEDAGGDFQLNGNNISVADLTSVNNSSQSGYPAWLAGPTVRNNNTTNTAVLTVGSDGGSDEYDGTFLDGSTKSLGLTKVGSGTLTLTGNNTNTGPVTVNGGIIALATGGPNSSTGAFSKAALIATGSGGRLSVSGRPDGTLTLNSGQTLSGVGTVTGSVTNNSGSILAPGLPTGTLSVSGSVTMNSGSTYLANINRGSTPNCGKLSAGSATYNGTLVVTNLGTRLQPGDVFQLFTTGVSGFTTYALQTSDVANNALYTWNNTVTTDGKVTVATVANLVSTNVTPILYTNLGTSLVLAWPADHIGWKLQAQTNSLATGIGTNWTTVANSTTTNLVIIPVVTTNRATFYRLRFN